MAVGDLRSSVRKVLHVRLVVSLASIILSGCIGPVDGDFRPTQLVGGFFLIKTSANQVVVSEQPRFGDRPFIPPKVVSIAIIGDTILAAQEPKTGEPEAGGTLQFWCLATKTGKLDGPLSEEELNVLTMRRFGRENVVFTDANEVLRVARDSGSWTSPLNE